MDLQDIWQEHRRWILGVLAGVIVFFAARSIIDSVFGGDRAVREAQRKAQALMTQEFYQPATRDEILAENDRLVAQVAELREALAFVPSEEFSLIGKGAPDIYFPAVAARVRGGVLRAAQESGVDFEDGNLEWPAPALREEIEKTLIGLAAIEAAALRLVAAGDRVRALDPEALGLVSIDSLKVQNRASGYRPGMRNRLRRGERDASDLVEENRIAFAIRCDVQTLELWLEALRGEDPPLALSSGDFTVTPGDQAGDPLVVKGQLLALTIQEPAER